MDKNLGRDTNYSTSCYTRPILVDCQDIVFHFSLSYYVSMICIQFHPTRLDIFISQLLELIWSHLMNDISTHIRISGSVILTPLSEITKTILNEIGPVFCYLTQRMVIFKDFSKIPASVKI